MAFSTAGIAVLFARDRRVVGRSMHPPDPPSSHEEAKSLTDGGDKDEEDSRDPPRRFREARLF